MINDFNFRYMRDQPGQVNDFNFRYMRDQPLGRWAQIPPPLPHLHQKTTHTTNHRWIKGWSEGIDPSLFQ